MTFGKIILFVTFKFSSLASAGSSLSRCLMPSNYPLSRRERKSDWKETVTFMIMLITAGDREWSSTIRQHLLISYSVIHQSESQWASLAPWSISTPKIPSPRNVSCHHHHQQQQQMDKIVINVAITAISYFMSLSVNSISSQHITMTRGRRDNRMGINSETDLIIRKFISIPFHPRIEH